MTEKNVTHSQSYPPYAPSAFDLEYFDEELSRIIIHAERLKCWSECPSTTPVVPISTVLREIQKEAASLADSARLAMGVLNGCRLQRAA